MDIVILEAVEFATKRYAYGKEPFRKYTDNKLPYVIHPVRVAQRVYHQLFHTHPYMQVRQAMLAAILHDILEDTDTQYEELAKRFGTAVAAIVLELTDHFTSPSFGNRATRKALERQRLAGVSQVAQCVKLADLEDNTETIVLHDPMFGKTYLREKRLLLDVLTKTPEAWRKRVIELTEQELHNADLNIALFKGSQAE